MDTYCVILPKGSGSFLVSGKSASRRLKPQKKGESVCVIKGPFLIPLRLQKCLFTVVIENLNYIENIKIEIIFKNYLETQRKVLHSLLFFLLVLHWNFFLYIRVII